MDTLRAVTLLQRVHKTPPSKGLYGVVFETWQISLKFLQQNLGTYLYIVCQNLWKF